MDQRVKIRLKKIKKTRIRYSVPGLRIRPPQPGRQKVNAKSARRLRRWALGGRSGSHFGRACSPSAPGLWRDARAACFCYGTVAGRPARSASPPCQN